MQTWSWKRGLAILLAVAGSVTGAYAQETLNVYGPGGPAPAMKEAARAFEEKTGIAVRVTAGPTNEWIDRAKNDAELLYSGAEHMMADFVTAMEGRLTHADVQPLYLRPLSILVRPGNPKGIRGVRDIVKPGIRVLVVNGAGQTGAWEDMAGRRGNLQTVRDLRRNIVAHAKNSAEARAMWVDKPEIDAWIIWNIWQVSNPQLAETVAIEPQYVIYRDTAVALTMRGKATPAAKRFVEFLASDQGAAIFHKWGWSKG